MQYVNETRRQHFVSQVEQRLNCCNPNSDSKKRIYSFRLTDRENLSVKLENEKGRLIESNLQLHDLFSFNVLDDDMRLNLEDLFNQYEKDIKTNTEQLLSKIRINLSDIKGEVLKVFVAKFMNFFRNPFCIIKVMNTIGSMAKFTPVDAKLREVYRQIDTGTKPHLNWICASLGIEAELYKNWLKCVFMMLMRIDGEPLNFLELTVKDLFENKSQSTQVFVFDYIEEHEEKCVLLSDRGFIIPIPEEAGMSFGFNLNSNSYITYMFLDLEKHSPAETPEGLIEAIQRLPKQVNVKYYKNDLRALEKYNQSAVYQSFQRVYAAKKTIYGI